MHAIATRIWLYALLLIGAVTLPAGSSHAASATIIVGQGVTLTSTVSGSTPFTYQWYKDGVALSGATSSTYSLSIFQALNAGSYTVVITNPFGSTTSDVAVLTSSIAAIAPVFTTQPTSQTVTAGNSVTFTAAASGSPTPTYQWRRNGTAVIGATSASYTIASTVTGNAGTYTVVATNSAGSATSSSATLTVNSLPAFTTQPVSQSVAVGMSVTFTAAATGSPAPTFQWRKNGSPITGATSASYTIATLTSFNAGSYTVVATNSAGSVTSNSATLTVATAVAPSNVVIAFTVE